MEFHIHYAELCFQFFIVWILQLVHILRELLSDDGKGSSENGDSSRSRPKQVGRADDDEKDSPETGDSSRRPPKEVGKIILACIHFPIVFLTTKEFQLSTCEGN